MTVRLTMTRSDAADESSGRSPRVIRLEERDRHLLSLVADGKTDIEIGIILGLSGKAINYHVERLKKAYGVNTRMQVVVTALRQGQIF